MATIQNALQKALGSDLQAYKEDYALKQLSKASFRGVIFYVRSEDISNIGRRKIVHEYPDKKGVFVEDLGELSPTISIPAFIHGIDFIENANKFETALKSKSSGQLEIPTFGISEDAFVLSIKKNASQIEVGVITFTIEFIVGTSRGAPFKAPALIPNIYEISDDMRQDFNNAYIGIDGEKSYWLLAQDILSLLVSANDLELFIRNMVRTISSQVVEGQLSDVLFIASNIQANANSLIKSGALLGDALFSISPAAFGFFQQLSISFPTDGSSLFTMIGLTKTLGTGGFFVNDNIKGDDVNNDLISAQDTRISLWQETTENRMIRNRNRVTLVQSMRLNCLSIAYEQASIRSYKTTDELQEARLALEGAYHQIMENDISDPTSIQNNESIRSRIDNLRSATLEVLEEKEQQAYIVQTISRINGLGTYGLSYKLYAEDLTTDEELTNRAIELRSLNSEQKNVYLVGNVNVFRKQ